jgi:O-antigen ligase
MFIALYPDVVGNILAALIVLAGGGYIVGRTHGDSEEFIRDVVLGCFGALLLCAPYISLTVRGSGDLSVAQNSVGLAVLQEVPMVATFALLLFDNSLSVKLRRSLWVTFVLVIIPFSIVLANRSSVLAGAVVFAYFFVLRIRRGNARKLIWGTLASLIALIGFGFLVLTQLHNVSGLGVLTRGVDRIAINLTLSQRGQGAFTDPSSQGRLDLYHQSVDLISQAPIFGHGIGAFGYLANYQVLDIYPHNMILEILINNGVVGLLFFLAALLPLLWFALRRAWPTNAGWQPIFIAGVLIEALVRHQVSMSITTGKLLFFTMGVISAQWAGLLKRREVKAEPDGVQSLPG